MSRPVADLRRDYARAGLDEADLAPTWLEQFDRWFAEAEVLTEPNAVVLATASPDGVPSARTVLLKAYDERGLVVFTNLTSRKATEALATARATLLFSWVDLERQVVVEGDVVPVDRTETEAYFRSRPRGSQIGAWTSRQSTVIAGRAVLEQRQAALEERFAGQDVPVPDFWGGLRVVPRAVELWQGRPSRLHDRLRYRREGQAWVVERLSRERMTRPTAESRYGLAARLRGATLDLTPLRESRPYRRLLFGEAVSIIGTQVTTVAVPLQVYAQTRSTAAVGLVGLAGLLPLVVFGLYGGAIADAVDRRRLVLLTTSGNLLLALVLVAQAVADVGSTALLYGIVACQAGLFAIDSPARQAFVPRLLRKELLPAANALKQVEFNLAVTTGPLLAGVLVAQFGYGAAYAVDAVTFLAALAAVRGLPAMPPAGGGRRAGTASVLEGLAFLRTRQVLLMTFVVDLVAMVFAMPRALFPALAQDVFGGGEQTAGLLYSSLAVGALFGALFSGWLGRIHRHGVAVLWAICAWGASITLFGLTDVLWVAVLCLAAAGLSDMVSAVFRTAILQAAAPDEMRGRLGGVFIVVVAGGPRLGDARAGGGAELVGLQGASVAGGLAVLGVTAAVAAGATRFRAYDARVPDGP